MYISENEISEFIFDDCRIVKHDILNNEINFVIEALIVCENNSQNPNFTESYAGESILTFSDAAVCGMIKQGYKMYDANDVLQEVVEDKELPSEEWPSVLGILNQGYLYKCAVCEKTDSLTKYELEVELYNEDVYTIYIQASGDRVTWKKYMNRVPKF